MGTAYQSRHIYSRGSKNPSAKLNWQIVKEIRKEYESIKISYVKLAKKYHVDASTIGRIIRKEIWPSNPATKEDN